MCKCLCKNVDRCLFLLYIGVHRICVLSGSFQHACYVTSLIPHSKQWVTQRYQSDQSNPDPCLVCIVQAQGRPPCSSLSRVEHRDYVSRIIGNCITDTYHPSSICAPANVHGRMNSLIIGRRSGPDQSGRNAPRLYSHVRAYSCVISFYVTHERTPRLVSSNKCIYK